MGNKNSNNSKLALTPITPKFLGESEEEFKVVFDLESQHKETNYGFLPVVCLHNILLYVDSGDLFNCFLSCKLINNVSSSQFFWKQMYFNYFETSEEDKTKSWKKRFVLTFKSEIYFQKRYRKWRKVIENPEFSQSGDRWYHKEKLVDFETRMIIDTRNVVTDCFYFDCLIWGKEEMKRPFIEALINRHGTHLYSIDNPRSRKPKIILYELLGMGFPSILKTIKFRKFQKEWPSAIIILFSLNKVKSLDFFNHRIIQARKTNKYRLFLLIGLLLENEHEGSRSFRYEEGVEFSKKMELLGYVEVDLRRGRNDNVFFCAGLILEGCIKRLKSLKKK